MRNTQLRDAIRRGLHLYGMAGASLAFTALPAIAQTTGDDTQSQKLETITVTGSNIRRVDIETANPVVTIDRAQIQKSGKLTVGDLLQELPSAAGGMTNPQVNNGGGNGASLIGLRGLGANRTLVLIDGQRVIANTLVGGADLNTIPAALIDRIEVLKDGASSVYGSDAIAGVVNFIMRKDYQGAEFSADYGISDKDDGRRKGYHLTIGQSTDKGSVVAGIDYNKFDAVGAGHRDFSKDSLYLYYGSVQALGSSRTPTGRIFLPPGLLQDRFGCGSVTRLPGTTGSSLDDYRCFRNTATADGPSDRYNYQPLNVILTPQERTNLFALANYKLSDSVEAYVKTFANKTVSSSLIAPYPFDAQNNAVTISADSLYNPFGVDFGPPDAAHPDNTNLLERLTGVGQRITSITTETAQFIGGLKGNIGDTSWHWDANLNYGHISRQTYNTGFLDYTKLAAALGPSMLVDGVPTCVATAGDPASAIAGCTPLNIFAQDDPASVAAFRAAASNPFQQQTQISREGTLNVSGDLFDLPAGAVSLAVGGLYRKEYSNLKVDSTITFDPATGTCDLGTACTSPLTGNITTKEAYAELFIPILKDVPFFHSLNVDIGTRYSKFSLAGNTSNSKLAVEWRPIEDLLVRGTVSEIFRSPNLSELFAGLASNAPTALDPCTGYIPGVSPAIHDAACGAATGATNIPSTGIAPQPNGQLNGVLAGAVAAGYSLKPESGKSFDFGVVYDPGWIDGLSLNADLYRIYLNDTITVVSAQNLLTLCYNDPTSAFCPFISRFTNGQVNQVTTPVVNLGRLDTSGVDFGVHYRVPEFDMFGIDPGRFNLGVDATYIKTFDNNPAPGSGAATISNAGVFTTQFGNIARLRGLGSLDWSKGPFEASWRVRYVGNLKIGSADLAQGLSADGSVPGIVRHIGAVTYHSFSFGYTLEPINTQIQIGVDNAFNKQPPLFYQNIVVNANTDVSTYDTVGRFYFGRVTVKF